MDRGRIAITLMLFVGIAGSAIAWLIFPGGDLVWFFRFLMPWLTIAALGFAAAFMRRDHAPDYLGWIARQGYFDRKGFCFAFWTSRRGTSASLDIYFQNRFERPCNAEVAIRPVRWFFTAPPPLDPVTVRIECGPAACGIARVSFPIPRELQGHGMSFTVGATVEYPHGKGRRMRFGLALPVELDSDFQGAPWMFRRCPSVRLPLPDGVDEVAKKAAAVEVRNLWIYGDKPLERWPAENATPVGQ